MLPQEFLNRMEDYLKEEYPLFLAEYEKEAYKALRRNPLKSNREEFERLLPFELRQVPWCSLGYYYSPDEYPGSHPFHQAGLYYVQEPSAMAPVEYLAPRPGEKVLDLCAAPGGKSTQIGGYLLGEGILVSNEPHPARAKILSENIERMGIRNALVTNELPSRLAEFFSEYFDKILVDAPCSGEGMFRKNEEARKEWSLKNVRLCADRQAGILDEAAGMLKSGGRMVYSTCTFSKEENEETIGSFCRRNPRMVLLEEKRIWPHKEEGEGHYMALLEKKEAERGEKIPVMEKTIEGKNCGEFTEFGKKSIVDFSHKDWRLYPFGDQLYHIPVDMPKLDGLKVLRPGLHLGTIKKNRFQPSHALALALTRQEVKFSLSLSLEDAKIMEYLSGQTFAAEGEKGWYLIMADGYGLGWGKLAAGTMKNHYPKGLRR